MHLLTSCLADVQFFYLRHTLNHQAISLENPIDSSSPSSLPRSSSPLSPEILLVVGLFFFNIFLLPAGLLYTTLLRPLFVLLLLKEKVWRPFLIYLGLSLVFAYQHFRTGVDTGAYMKSYILFSSAFVFSLWVFHFLRQRHEKLQQYFQQITLYNTFFVVLAIVGLLLPVAREVLWYDVPIHAAIPAFPRLRLLVYEPSFYSLLLAPIVLYYFTAFVFSSDNQHLFALVLLCFALLLSLSFGVLGGMVIAILAVFVLNAGSLLRRKRIFYASIYLFGLVVIVGFLLWNFFPFNPVVDRVGKIFAGHDSSANGRTWEAFMLAWKILEHTDIYWGAGWGQIKIVGQPIIVEYYNYEGEWRDLVRIPNASAETLASLGLLGLAGRLLAEIGLFFYTKVYSNYYRMILFAFIFLYQFTGSYLTNIYEYLIWILVFLPIFPQFNRR